MSQSRTDLPNASLLRRLAAILYDGLLLIALLFIAAAVVLPLTGGQAVHSGNPLFTSYLFIVAFVFYAWFWTHGGQTLGMRAWRLRVVRYDGGPISLWQALLRYLIAYVSWGALGAGFWWSLVDREKLTWHDRYSQTKLIVLPKR